MIVITLCAMHDIHEAKYSACILEKSNVRNDYEIKVLSSIRFIIPCFAQLD